MLNNLRVVAIAAGLVLAGCAGSHPALDSSRAMDLLAGPVPSGKARIYVMAGCWYIKDRTPRELLQDFAVSVDGVSVAHLGPEEVVAVDVPAGLRIVTRYLISMWGVSKEPVLADLGYLAPGQRVYVEMNRVGGESHIADASPAGKLMATALASALGTYEKNSPSPHAEAGGYLDVAGSEPQLLRERTLISADPVAVTRLNSPRG